MRHQESAHSDTGAGDALEVEPGTGLVHVGGEPESGVMFGADGLHLVNMAPTWASWGR